MSEKIGRSVLSFDVPKVDKTFTQNWSKEHRERILAVLSQAERPLNISEIQRATKAASWLTIKGMLIDLELEGKLEHFRSGRAILFRLKRKVK